MSSAVFVIDPPFSVDPTGADRLLVEREFPDDAPRKPTITAREADVLSAICAGEAPKKIAGRLGLSVRTVEVHLFNIRNKTGARTTAQAAVFFATGKIEVASA